MSPSQAEIRALVGALLSVSTGLERVRRQTKGADVLSLLEVIAPHEHGIRPAAIAERREVHPSHVARQIRECEGAGLVSVSPDPADRRSLLVALEPAGSAELGRLLDSSVERFAPFVDDWEPDEVRRMTELLDKLRASMTAVAARQRSRARRGSARASGGLPDWFVDWLDR
jgi:DNA-binding MarR family transcriptional regulator